MVFSALVFLPVVKKERIQTISTMILKDLCHVFDQNLNSGNLHQIEQNVKKLLRTFKEDTCINNTMKYKYKKRHRQAKLERD